MSPTCMNHSHSKLGQGQSNCLVKSPPASNTGTGLLGQLEAARVCRAADSSSYVLTSWLGLTLFTHSEAEGVLPFYTMRISGPHVVREYLDIYV